MLNVNVFIDSDKSYELSSHNGNNYTMRDYFRNYGDEFDIDDIDGYVNDFSFTLYPMDLESLREAEEMMDLLRKTLQYEFKEDGVYVDVVLED